jgi:hypothetical protein
MELESFSMATALPNSDILFEKRRRLEQLQRQQARKGWDSEAATVNEIQDLQRELAAAGPATVAQSHDILYDLIQSLQTRIDRLYWFMLALAAVIILAVKL